MDGRVRSYLYFSSDCLRFELKRIIYQIAGQVIHPVAADCPWRKLFGIPNAQLFIVKGIVGSGDTVVHESKCSGRLTGY